MQNRPKARFSNIHEIFGQVTLYSSIGPVSLVTWHARICVNNSLPGTYRKQYNTKYVQGQTDLQRREKERVLRVDTDDMWNIICVIFVQMRDIWHTVRNDVNTKWKLELNKIASGYSRTNYMVVSVLLQWNTQNNYRYIYHCYWYCQSSVVHSSKCLHLVV